MKTRLFLGLFFLYPFVTKPMEEPIDPKILDNDYIDASPSVILTYMKKCDLCNEMFLYAEDLAAHRLEVHSNLQSTVENQKLYKKDIQIICGFAIKAKHYCACDTIFENGKKLQRHLRNNYSHTRWIPCPEKECQMSYKSQVHLRKHKKFHKNPNAVSCKQCLLVFSNKNALDTHLKNQD